MSQMTDITNWGYPPSIPVQDEESTGARVTAVYRDRYELICPFGVIFAKLKTGVYYERGEQFPTVGDFVRIQYVEHGDSLITKTLPRRSFFSRRDPTPGRGEQAVAANFDCCFILSSLNRDFNLKRIERYLTLAWQSGAVPVVVLTKADLIDEQERLQKVHAAQSISFGADVVALSAVTGYGLGHLEKYLVPKKTIVFLGSSGVGKSSLLNAVSGEDKMTVNEIRAGDDRGRHTTTHRQLFMLPPGAMVIDTPGMRELGMWDVTEGLDTAFSDVTSILERGCKFFDCRHKSEPGCAILAAIESGELSRERYESYLALGREARYADDKIGFMRKRQQRSKEIAKFVRQHYKNGGRKS